MAWTLRTEEIPLLGAPPHPTHPSFPEGIYQPLERRSQSRESWPWLFPMSQVLSQEDSRPLLCRGISFSSFQILEFSASSHCFLLSWQMHLTSQLTPFKTITELAPLRRASAEHFLKGKGSRDLPYKACGGGRWIAQEEEFWGPAVPPTCGHL